MTTGDRAERDVPVYPRLDKVVRDPFLVSKAELAIVQKLPRILIALGVLKCIVQLKAESSGEPFVQPGGRGSRLSCCPSGTAPLAALGHPGVELLTKAIDGAEPAGTARNEAILLVGQSYFILARYAEAIQWLEERRDPITGLR